jgi:hypothetical protein
LGKYSFFKGFTPVFEVTSGFIVNFHKIMLVGVNVSISWLNEDYMVLNFKIGQIPFHYLRLPIGGDSHKLNWWKPLVDRINYKLFRWKSHNLSLGGRLVLLKSLMSSFLFYFLSFFKALAGIITSLESIFYFIF